MPIDVSKLKENLDASLKIAASLGADSIHDANSRMSATALIAIAEQLARIAAVLEDRLSR